MTSKIVKSSTIDESAWRHGIAYAASVSLMPSHHKNCASSARSIEFPPMPRCPPRDLSVSLCAYPPAELAPHRLLTFPPAVPRGPDKTPLYLSLSLSIQYIPRTAGLVSSPAAGPGPDSRHAAQGSKGSNSVPCKPASVIRRQWLVLVPIFGRGHRSQTEPIGHGAKSPLRQVSVCRFNSQSAAQSHAGPSVDTRTAGLPIHKQSSSRRASRSVDLLQSTAASRKVPSLNLQ